MRFRLKNILKRKKKQKTMPESETMRDDYIFTSSLKEGDQVVLVSGYINFSGADEGPLKPGDIGIIIENDRSYKPFKIEFNEKTWWYDEKSIELYVK